MLPMIGVVLATACHHTVQTPAVPARLIADYCRWAVFRAPLPHDSVAARFQRAFAQLGATNTRSTSSADTPRVHAGQARWDGAVRDSSFESWMIAYQHGDSTHFRTFVALTPPPSGADTSLGTSDFPCVCGHINRRAAVGGRAPRDPEGEERLPVWKLQP